MVNKHEDLQNNNQQILNSLMSRLLLNHPMSGEKKVLFIKDLLEKGANPYAELVVPKNHKHYGDTIIEYAFLTGYSTLIDVFRPYIKYDDVAPSPSLNIPYSNELDDIAPSPLLNIPDSDELDDIAPSPTLNIDKY